MTTVTTEHGTPSFTELLRGLAIDDDTEMHTEYCWIYHPHCALGYAADEIDFLNEENEGLRRTVERLEREFILGARRD